MQRIACFYIEIDLVNEQPEVVAAVLANLKAVPLRVECNWSKHRFEYVALSEKFREVEPQYEPPLVDLIVNAAPNGEVESVDVVYS